MTGGPEFTETEQIVLDSAERVLAECCDADVVASAERGNPNPRLAKAIRESGLALTWVSESAGGIGCDARVGFALIEMVARYAAPDPLVETLLANWLAQAAGLVPAESAALIKCEDTGSLANSISASAEAVPYASAVEQLLLVNDGAPNVEIAWVEATQTTIEQARNLAGEPFDRVQISDVSPTASGVAHGYSWETVRAFLATARAHQIAGGLDRMLQLTADHVSQRKQFGRPLIRFQAVQQMVADIAAQTALCRAATQQAAVAWSNLENDSRAALRAAATAKVVTGEAAGIATRLAHQAHGAMGFSAEYPLSHYTRRLWDWRDAEGSELEWARWLGYDAAQCGVGAWRYVTDDA